MLPPDFGAAGPDERDEMLLSTLAISRSRNIEAAFRHLGIGTEGGGCTDTDHIRVG